MQADYLKHTDVATQYGTDLSGGSLTTGTNISVSTSENSLSFNADITSADGAVVSINNANASNAITSLGLPRVESNLFTRYETYIAVS
mmetsp:Transcript_21615/g.3535  ORF Transcript_21615/g.3535 Transcript_21615/m.3535 type:complete len:88 (+) Transcript_21615:1587-1850(+)